MPLPIDARLSPLLAVEMEDVVAVLPSTVSPARILSLLRCDVARVRDDLVGGDNRAGGSGGAFGVFVELDGWFLKASTDRRYPDPVTAIELEWNDEVRRQRLGIYHPERIWFLLRGVDARFWGCSVTPILPVLRDRLNAGALRGPDPEAWKLYLDAFRMTFDIARRESLLLDCNPNNFGIGQDRLYYLDDDLAPGTGRMPFGHQLLLRLREYESGDVSAQLELVRGFAALADEVRGETRLRDQLREDLESRITWPTNASLRAALEELLESLAPPRRSASRRA